MRRKHKYHRDEKRQIGAILDFKEIEPMKMNSEQQARREPEGFRDRVFNRNDLILEDYYYLDHLLTHSAAVRAEIVQSLKPEAWHCQVCGHPLSFEGDTYSCNICEQIWPAANIILFAYADLTDEMFAAPPALAAETHHVEVDCPDCDDGEVVIGCAMTQALTASARLLPKPTTTLPLTHITPLAHTNQRLLSALPRRKMI